MRTIAEQRERILEMADPDREGFAGIVTVFDDALKTLDWAERALPRLKDYSDTLKARLPGLDYIPDPEARPAHEGVDALINELTGK